MVELILITSMAIMCAHRLLASAVTVGLMVYFLGVDKHLAKINIRNNIRGGGDDTWAAAVIEYTAKIMATQRSPYDPNNPLTGQYVIYNGEIPQGSTAEAVCPAAPDSGAAPPPGKRQTLPVGGDINACASPEQISSMSVSSAARVASISSTSVASVSRYVQLLGA